MTDATSVVWEPELTPLSLPTGLPLSEGDDETLLSPIAGRCFVGTYDPTAWSAHAWVERTPSFRYLREQSSDVGADGPPDTSVRYQLTPEGRIVALRVETGEAVTNRSIHGSLDAVKSGLEADWTAIARLVGTPRRTFFKYRREESYPANRRSEIWARTNLFRSFLAEDVMATKALITTRLNDVATYLDGANFLAVRTTFDEVRRQVRGVTMLSARAAVDAFASRLEQASSLVRSPDFDALAEAYTSLRAAGGDVSRRVGELIAFERAIKAAGHGDDLDEDWDFLVMMRRSQLDELRRRVRDLLASPEFSEERWGEFKRDERGTAWSAYDAYVPPPADDAEDLGNPPVAASPGDPRHSALWAPDFVVPIPLHRRLAK